MDDYGGVSDTPTPPDMGGEGYQMSDAGMAAMQGDTGDSSADGVPTNETLPPADATVDADPNSAPVDTAVQPEPDPNAQPDDTGISPRHNPEPEREPGPEAIPEREPVQQPPERKKPEPPEGWKPGGPEGGY